MSIYQNALDVQSASNLSGVVFQFARDMKHINEEVRANGGGTEQVNKHPVCRLYAEQIAWLTRAGGCLDPDTYRAAHDACGRKVEEERELQVQIGKVRNTMMSVEVIIAVNNEIAQQAAREGLVPYIPISADEMESPFIFPNIGSLKPRGWRKTGATWFVDKTGHGESWEPALTWSQFRQRLAGYLQLYPDHGFAITEEGECQVVVSAFRKR